MMTPREIVRHLRQFRGIDDAQEYHGISATAGVRWFCEETGCQWIVDDIVKHPVVGDDDVYQTWMIAKDFDDDGQEKGVWLKYQVSAVNSDEDIDSREWTYEQYEIPITALYLFVTADAGKRVVQLCTESPDINPRTFLLNWNPTKWTWDDLPDTVQLLDLYGLVDGRWSSGNRKDMDPNDRVFLIKLGEEPRGIVASGTVASHPYEEEHWDGDKAQDGTPGLYVDIEWDDILDPNTEPILLKSDLERDVSNDINWSNQASGVQIPDAIACRLEQVWNEFLANQEAATGANDLLSGNESIVEGIDEHAVRSGFGDAETNRRVERSAIDIVTRSYQEQGWTVTSVEQDRCGYDLRCCSGNQEEHVEVKGTQAATPSFIITANEHRQAQIDPLFRLIVVTGALAVTPMIHEYTGQEMLSQFDFEPIAYRATRR